MTIWKTLGRFTIGGTAYVGLELLWRGRSHPSMFLAGGICFLLLAWLEETSLPGWVKPLAGAAAITAVELGTGLLVNRTYQVWDYRGQPGNLLGQVCPLFSILWIFVAWFGIRFVCLLRKLGL